MSEEAKVNRIKVSDIIDLSNKTIENMDATIKRLKELTDDYYRSDDITSLEKIKREFVSQLQYMASLFSHVKKYKGSNHTYLESAIKRIKAEAIDILMANGSKVTVAEREVYAHPYYTDRMAVAEQLIRLFIKFELLYDQFSATLQCIVQSISVANKDYSNQKISGQ